MRLQHSSVLAQAMTKADTTLVLQYPQIGFLSGVQVTIDKEVFTLEDSADGLTWTFGPRVSAADHAVKRAVYGPKCTSWQEAADLNVDTYDWTDCADNAHFSPVTEDLTYVSYQRAALAQALHAGLAVPELSDAYAWIDAEIRAWVAKGKLKVGDNWAVMPGATRRRRRHRSDRGDPQRHPRLLAILDAIRGEDT